MFISFGLFHEDFASKNMQQVLFSSLSLPKFHIVSLFEVRGNTDVIF